MSADHLAETKMHPVERPAAGTPIEIPALHALTRAMLPQAESSGDFVRRMRDEHRY